MGCLSLLYYFTFQLFLLLTHFSSQAFSKLCNDHDSYALLQFNNSIGVVTEDDWSFCSSFSYKTNSWKRGKNCCEWDGVTCDSMSGHVIGLDLSCSNLRGEFHPNSTIFELKHLQTLNLAFNDFSGSSIYAGIGDLKNIKYLNLSYTQISGNIPSTISHLSKLESLDLSNDDSLRTVDSITWKKLILNATNLRELHLDGVDLSSIKESSLSLLMNLSSSLVSISLRSTGLQGNFPTNILSLPNLEKLDLSSNTHVSGQLPKSNWSTPLKHLGLSFTAFSGEIPDSIGNLKSLNILLLSDCNFVGLVPLSFWNLTQLSHLELANNNLKGEIPSLLSNLSLLNFFELSGNDLSGHIPDVFHKLVNLEVLGLSFNNLEGHVPPSLFHLTQLSSLALSSNKLVGQIPIEITKHSKLHTLHLDHNLLNGTIPYWCYSLPLLLELHLNYNQLTGSIGEFSTFSLQVLFISNNRLQGDIPNSLFELENLGELSLSSNNLSGLVDWKQFSKLKSLAILDLSHNRFLSINIDTSVDSILPNLQSLFLSSCDINSFPKFLARHQNLIELDLSNNEIGGEIPNWFQTSLLHSWKDIHRIDLSFNKLQGDLPIPPDGTRYFLVSNNNFTGDNIALMCNASSLDVINLAYNNIRGTIPQCLGLFPSLSVLDMQMNNLYGSMPRSFSKKNSFETIKLNGNKLEGPLPHSFVRCAKLEVLDLGDNVIEDTFPNWLENLQELQVLSLRSNKFYGPITCSSNKHSFPKLRIFDVSNNSFSNLMPTSCIKNFQGMMNVKDSKIGLQYMGKADYYNDSLVVIMKGLKVELTRILTTFTTIDLSNNLFEGEISQVIGELHSLKGLNLSHNGIKGTIPSSLGNLRNLEWLDLSRNELMGEIPMALTNLNFLSFLNLSQNQLTGIIPTGKQFNTFGNVSYEGNPMLCGFPLSKSCKNDEEPPPHSAFEGEGEEESWFGWKAVAIGYACGTIFGALLGFNVFRTGKPQWIARLIENMFNTTLRRRKSNRANTNLRRMN